MTRSLICKQTISWRRLVLKTVKGMGVFLTQITKSLGSLLVGLMVALQILAITACADRPTSILGIGSGRGVELATVDADGAA
jgi:hypothetical protein